MVVKFAEAAATENTTASTASTTETTITKLVAAVISMVRRSIPTRHGIIKTEKENEKEMSKKTDIGWGHQIRSYVLQPYRLVKDLRTNIQDSDPEKILNGNIDKFIEGNILI